MLYVTDTYGTGYYTIQEMSFKERIPLSSWICSNVEMDDFALTMTQNNKDK